MRNRYVQWMLVGVALGVAALVLLLLRPGGERQRSSQAGESRAASALAAEEPALQPAATVEAPVAPLTAVAERSELVHENPRVAGLVRVDDGAALGEEVELAVAVHDASGARAGTLEVPVAADGRFEFVVPAGTGHVQLTLRAEALFLPSAVRAVPGEEVVLVVQRRAPEAALAQDLVVAGVVLDQHGQPFEGASLYAIEPEASSWRLSDENQSGPDGRFRLTGLARQRWRIGAQSSDAFGNAHQDIDGTRGDVLDLTLTLVRGGCIEGTVRWPDGRAVQEFRTKAQTQNRSRSSTSRGGEFKLCGLDLDVEWTLVLTAQEGTTAGTVQVPGLRPGGPPLALVLETADTFAVALDVRDAEGAPVPNPRAYAVRRGEGVGEVQAKASVLEGLTPGEWSIHVSVPGFEDQSRIVTLAPGSAPLGFVLAARGHIRGRVVDAGGAAVAGAEVSDETTGDDEQLSDSEGRFELEVSSGVHRLRARHALAGISAALEVELASGESVEDVVLTLGPAARLEGRVLDVAGRPASGVSVFAGMADTTTDSNGAFVLEGLAPGTARVFARDSAGQGLVHGEVKLLRGETSTLELRFLARDPVRVRGRATLAGQPYFGPLQFVSQGGLRQAGFDREGRFSVELDRPGRWICWRNELEALYALEFELPDVDEHELTLDLDTMRRVASFDELPF